MVRKYILKAFVLLGFIVVMSLSACNDDLKLPDETDKISGETHLIEYDLPGYLAINLRMGSATRGDEEGEEESEGNDTDTGKGDLSSENATAKETALAPTTDGENYHFALFFGKDGRNLFIPLETSTLSPDLADADISAGLKLAVKKVYASTEFVKSVEGAELETKINDLKKYLDGIDNRVYVLLNFDWKQIKNNSDKTYSNNEAYIKENFKTKEDLEKIEYKSYTIRAKNEKGVDTDYFTMTSAIYVKDNEVVPASIVNTSNIYYTQTNAFNGEPTLKAFVERLAVKYRLKITKGAENNTLAIVGGPEQLKVFSRITTTGDFVITTTPVNWKVRIEGFHVNAVEPTEYLFKSIKDENYFNTWNYPLSYLSYWAEDPHYNIEKEVFEKVPYPISLSTVNSKLGYPHQYRDAIETDSIRSYVNYDYENGSAPYLNYKSFNAITNNSEEFYSLENTFVDNPDFSYHEKYHTLMADGVGPYNYFTSSTHFILACTLIIGDYNIIRDIYHDEDDIYYADKAQLLDAKLTLLNDRNLAGGSADIRVLNVDWFNTGGKHESDLRIMTWPKGARLYYQPKGGEMREAVIGDLDVIPAQLSGGDGKVLIGPHENNRGDNGQFYLVAEGAAQAISNNELVSLFHKFSGAIDFYSKGKMYYVAPITHNKNSMEKKSWKTPGDIGVVRNNLYEVTLKGVKAPGHSVSEAADPIIPMLDNYRDYLSARVRVLRWHEVAASVTPIPSQSDSN